MKKLTEEQENICFLKGTEAPFSGKYLNEKRAGVYKCVVCETPLFSGASKFESGTGWPSFDSPIKDNVEFKKDLSLGMERTEVTCKKCGSHLGHIFNDGPTQTGKRYCINFLALEFIPES